MKAILIAFSTIVAMGVSAVLAAPSVELSATYYPSVNKIEFISSGPWAGRDLAVHYTCEDDGNIVLDRKNRLYKLKGVKANWVVGTPDVAWDSCSGVIFEIVDPFDPSTWVNISNTVTVTS